MLRPSVGLDCYGYDSSDVIISIPGRKEAITVLPAMVTSIIIIKDFDNKISPYLALSMNVRRENYKEIMTSISTMTVSMSINKFKLVEGVAPVKQRCMKGIFRAINQDLLDPSFISKFKKVDNNVTNEPENTTADYISVSLYLFDATKIAMMRKMMSTTLKGNTIDCVASMFSRRGFSDVLMSPIRKPVSGTFIIPYSTLNGALHTLSTRYALYTSDYTFFMDSDTTYLLDNGNVGSAVRKMEPAIVSMYLEENSSKEATDPGCFSDATRCIVNMTAFPLILDNLDIVGFMDSDKYTGVISGSSVVTRIGNQASTLERAVLMTNASTLSINKHKLDESRCPITATFADIDIDIIRPNKKFELITHADYKEFKINGSYRLSSVMFILSKQGETTMRMGCECNLKKQP
jgi:hypothetical protein